MELTVQQLQALQTFAANNGKYWKRLLSHAWETGDYQTEDDSASLQQIRNSFGPSWLVRFSLKKSKQARYVVERTIVKDVRPCTGCGLTRVLLDTFNTGDTQLRCPACGRVRHKRPEVK